MRTSSPSRSTSGGGQSVCQRRREHERQTKRRCVARAMTPTPRPRHEAESTPCDLHHAMWASAHTQFLRASATACAPGSSSRCERPRGDGHRLRGAADTVRRLGRGGRRRGCRGWLARCSGLTAELAHFLQQLRNLRLQLVDAHLDASALPGRFVLRPLHIAQSILDGRHRTVCFIPTTAAAPHRRRRHNGGAQGRQDRRPARTWRWGAS